MENNAAAVGTFIGGGFANEAWAPYSVTAGGAGNGSHGDFSATLGGSGNRAEGKYSVVAGGTENRAKGENSTVPGGYRNEARGVGSFAAGSNALAKHDGSFVWADASSSSPLETTGNNQFIVRAVGGTTFISDAFAGSFSGVTLTSGAGSWSNLSSREAKEEIRPVDVQAVLERLSQLSISTWKYKSQSSKIRHMGPMAEDFYSAFGLGENPTRLTTIDTDGVALAAIQGLYRLLQEKAQKIRSLEKRLEALETRRP
jgi:hypothetical protein